MGQLLLPLYAQSMHLLMPASWHIASLQLTRQGHEEFITVRVETSAPFVMAGQSIPAGVGMNGSTLLSHALLPSLVMLSSLFAWLFFATRRTTGPVVLLLFFLMLVESLDVPMVLVGSLWDILHANITTNSPVPWQVRAMDLLNGGGRQALFLAAPLAAVGLGNRLQSWCSGASLQGKSNIPTA